MCEQYLVWTALGVPQGKIRFLLDTVQVFMKPVQQKGQQLLGVLLLVAGELRGKTSNLRLGGESVPSTSRLLVVRQVFNAAIDV